MLAIDEAYIKKVLGKHASLLQDIHARILGIHGELMDTDGLIESISMKKADWGGEGGSMGGVKKDLLDAMLKHERLARARELELREEIYRLTEEEEAINRIQACFRALRGREQRYLQQLYVERIPYKAVELASGVSHKTFETARRRGVRKILQMYNSKFSNREIISRGAAPKKAQPKEKAGYEQLRLNL